MAYGTEIHHYTAKWSDGSESWFSLMSDDRYEAEMVCRPEWADRYKVYPVEIVLVRTEPMRLLTFSLDGAIMEGRVKRD